MWSRHREHPGDDDVARPGLGVLGGPGDLVNGVISRVTSTRNGVPLIVTLLITDLLSPTGLQVGSPFRKSKGPGKTRWVWRFRVWV